jgi:hypothetical protein
MPEHKEIDVEIHRRGFLTRLAAAFAASAAVLRGAPALQDNLLMLKSGDLERLRLDFNGNRQKVRLLAVLSPT